MFKHKDKGRVVVIRKRNSFKGWVSYKILQISALSALLIAICGAGNHAWDSYIIPTYEDALLALVDRQATTQTAAMDGEDREALNELFAELE
jgi:hypothetical protein